MIGRLHKAKVLPATLLLALFSTPTLLELTVTAPPASAATGISGTILCPADFVTGVWIQASRGGSGWAQFSPTGNNVVNYSYELPNGGAWTVHVGCGGTRSNWRYAPNGNTTTTRTYVNWICFTPDDGLYPVKYYCAIN